MDQARAQADARSAQDWLDDDVRKVLGMVHIREWKRILDANRYYRQNTLTVAQDANGQIALSSLDAGSGDAQKRFYRVLWVLNGTLLHDEEQYAHLPTATLVGGNNVSPCWYRTGDYLQIIPVGAGTSMTIVVNHTPTPIDQLSDDTIAAEFPRDYELIVAYEAAAWLLAKGGRETSATADLQRLADQMRSEMLGDIVRISTDPVRMDFPDTRWAWGSM